jgi:nicotinamidase-related amidase
MASIRAGNRRILLVVDTQAGIVDGCWEAGRVVANIALAVERARAQGAPVLWVQHSDDELLIESEPWQLAAGLVPAAGERVIRKLFNSPFEETPLEHELARLRATHIVLAGAMTNWCIRATAHAVLERGYDLTLLKDAHTTGTIALEDGSRIEAKDVVDELNLAMTWMSYPGRTTTTAKSAEVEFGAAAT